ncbi:MAG: dynamin-related GTPase [Monoraphidium minutum]|nr:MAG: dynamin-related GTPase [Monoraphidium minutum]
MAQQPATFGAVVGLVNKLQQICTQLGDTAGNSILVDKLSSIVVVGGQSSGKSSVLEAVVGRDFLPRGTGIVTRRPLVLNLVHTDDPKGQEYGEFMHRQGQKVYDFEKIRQEIEDETERHLSKGSKVVSPIPIYLTIYSPVVPNLTLVDMPGLTKVAIEGQPPSIVQDLEDMCKQYIKGDNAIILAVSPANADLATSDALRLAKEVDPLGERTIGVLTKIDIMDKGTDCRDVLCGRSLRLRHGWVGVSTESYRDLDNTGTTYLANKLSNHLVSEITRKLPEIQSYVDKTILDYKHQLTSLGSDVGANRGKMLHLILTLCQKVEKAFTRIVEGGEGGGERILEVFDVKLKESIYKLPFDKILTLKNVRNTINEADGYQPHIIAPEAGYRRLIEDGLSLLRDPSSKAVEGTHQILKSIVAAAINEVPELQRFVNLKSEIIAHAAITLDKLKESADGTVRTLVDMEGSYLSANFFREIVAAESFSYDPTRPKPQFVTLAGEILLEKRYDGMSAADAHLQRISDHVSAYLQIVRSQLLATVPKGVVHCIVVPAKDTLLSELQEEVAGKEEAALRRLLNENEEVARQRDGLKKRLELMERAAAEIMNFRV